MADELYSLQRCADLADVSLSTIKRDALEGRLVTTRIRGCVKVHPRDWEGYLQQCRSAGMERSSRSASKQEAGASVDLSEAIAMLPNLSDVLDKGSKIVALDARRNTRSRKRSHAG
jgi:hypothetical protein